MEERAKAQGGTGANQHEQTGQNVQSANTATRNAGGLPLWCKEELVKHPATDRPAAPAVDHSAHAQTKKNPAQGPGCNPATGAGPIREVNRGAFPLGVDYARPLRRIMAARASVVTRVNHCAELSPSVGAGVSMPLAAHHACISLALAYLAGVCASKAVRRASSVGMGHLHELHLNDPHSSGWWLRVAA